MTRSPEPPTSLFEVVHGSTVIKIYDDWRGHVLIEKPYEGLRQARKTRDKGQLGPGAPSAGSDAENAMIETAMFHGFEPIGDPLAYRATVSHIVALMVAAREHGRQEALQMSERQD